MCVWDFKSLSAHVGHELECVLYGENYEYEGDAVNVSLECMTCGEVIIDFDREEEEE
jgi:hypothetical protein